MYLLEKFSSFITKIFKKKNKRVVAFIGKSGTGKSYRAQPVAKKVRADFIIDDGLLISGDKIVAGHSAKKEDTFLAAMRVCLFDDNKHKNEVSKILNEKKTKRVLVLGTSERMIYKITTRLSLPSPYKIIRIEDVATKEDIAEAQRQRIIEGKHVIPLPSFEVKKNYPHIFYEKVRLFFKPTNPSVIHSKTAILFEKSVVRPKFFKREIQRVPINILQENIKKYINNFNSIIVVKEMKIDFESKGYNISLLLDYPYYSNIAVSIKQLQKEITEKIEKYDNTFVSNINVVIDQMISVKDMRR
ncbi:MAG: hypothetical protein ACTTKH_02575 [Treponema sp.]